MSQNQKAHYWAPHRPIESNEHWLGCGKVLRILAIILMVVVLGWILLRAGQRIKQLPDEEV